MANGESASRPASRVVSELADLAAKGALVYPILLQAGVAYWAKWVDMGLGYYSSAARQWTRTVQEPERRAENVQKIIDDFKAYLASLAQVPGQAVLTFNQKVEELIRTPTQDPSSGRPPEQTLGRKVIEDLGRLSNSSRLKDLAGQAGSDLPNPEGLKKALANLEKAQEEVLRARREVHGAADAALQAARKLAGKLEATEEPPVDMLRRVSGDLERINASVTPKSKPEV